MATKREFCIALGVFLSTVASVPWQVAMTLWGVCLLTYGLVLTIASREDQP